MRNFKAIMVLRALQKIMQSEGNEGNTSVIHRMPMFHAGAVVYVPCVSANALRRCCVREPGGRYLMDAYGLRGALSPNELRLLICGGGNATEKGGFDSLKERATFRENLPLISLCGAGLPSGPKEGCLQMSDAMLVCRETATYVESIAGDVVGELDINRSCVTMVGRHTNYRHDPLGKDISEIDPLRLDESAKDNDGMIYGGEHLMPGVVLVVEILAREISEVELGCLLWSMRLWNAQGAFIGGKSSHHFGRTEAMLHLPDEVNAEAAIDAYRDLVDDRRETAVALMRSLYAKAAKPAKESKPKKAKATESVGDKQGSLL